MSGKGDTPRPGDSQRYREEYDRIFARREGSAVRQQLGALAHGGDGIPTSADTALGGLDIPSRYDARIRSWP